MRAKILLVDDSHINLELMNQLLGRDDYEISVAETGQDALTAVRTDPAYDLILLDVALDDTDGITVCRKLKSDPSTGHIPIVLISGVRTDDDSIEEGLEAGADGYVVKPITDSALRAWVRATLRISRLQRQLAAASVSSVISGPDLLRLFSTLSHAVNNPLQALYAAADTLALELPEESHQQVLVSEIISQAERIAQIVAGASLQAREQLDL